MEDVSILEVIIDIAVAVVPLLIAYLTNRKTTEESVWFSYITLTEEKFVKKTKLKSNIYMIILLLLYMAMAMNRIFYVVPINEIVAEKTVIIGAIVMVIVVLGQTFCNSILAYSEIECLDKRMRKQNNDISDLDDWIKDILTGLLCIGFVASILIQNNSVMESIILFSLLFVFAGVGAVCNYFIYLYVKIRRWYQIEDIIIKTKTSRREYRKTYNYKKKAGVFEFVCEDGNELKRCIVPISEIEYIEKIINEEITFLDVMKERLERKNAINKENKEVR